MTKTLLAIGFGYSARALARRLGPDWTVIGTRRDASRDFANATAVTWPGDDLTPHIKRATHVLLSVAPDAEGDPVLRSYRETFAHAKHLEWVGYLSTTGVYGDHAGGWVDESTPLSPSTRRGQWRQEAEAAWQSLDLPLHIFRLAGIYGPGRGPFAKVRAGTARRIIKEAQVFSRIHVEDIAQVLEASIRKPRPGAIYNLCDNDPAPPQDVIAYAAELLDLPAPEAVAFEDAEMTPMARSFYAESKKVRNDLIKGELGVELLYPDYKSGLKALLRDE